MDLNVYFPVFLLLGITLVSGVATVSVAVFFGPRRRQRMKQAVYECGLPPADLVRRQVSVKYYIVAVLFILFDIETIYLIPWAVVYREKLSLDTSFGLVILAMMLSFVAVLLIGLIYVFRQGILNWNK